MLFSGLGYCADVAPERAGLTFRQRDHKSGSMSKVILVVGTRIAGAAF
jgi:hypothetical protein